MRTTPIRKAIIAVAALALALSFVAVQAPASDAAPLHGITLLKGCQSPTLVGQKTKCNFTIANNVDPDTLTITALRDVVHAAGGDETSANILPQLTFTASGGASCNVGQTVCTLPPGSQLVTATPFAFHVVTGADADNANPLTDAATLTWQDSCSGREDNCPVGNQSATSGSQTAIQKLPSSTSTVIHNAQHQVVTAVPGGTVVHDNVTVEGPAGGPTPTGNVTVDWFTNNECSETPNSTSAPTPLNSNGKADVTAFKKTVQAGQFAFLAHYAGDSSYQPSDGACEPLTVVDAAITIAPAATNEVGKPHTFTVTVTRNDGTGWTPAAGVPVSYTLTDTNGATHVTSPNPPTTCDGTTNGNGKCDIVFVSSTAGKVTGNASVTLTLAGITITRDTDPATAAPSGPGGSGPKVKTYVDASIAIAPDATNEVGQPHTFTVTAMQNNGSGNGFVPVPDGTQPKVTLTNANGAVAQISTNTCAGAGTVNGQCTVTFTSQTPGRVTGNASMTIKVGGVSLTRDTNAATDPPSGPGGSGSAKKFFVDASIAIGPGGTNFVNDPHTFTVTVMQNDGGAAGWVPAPDGTTPTVTLTDTDGASSHVITNTCTSGTVNGQCSVTFTSPTTGTTTGNASVTLTLHGLTVTRDTDPATATVGSGPGGSGPAVKHWIQIQTSASTAQFAYPNDHATITSGAPGDNLPSTGTLTFRLYQAGGGNSALQNCQAGGGTLGAGGLLYQQVFSNVGGSHSVTVDTTNTSVKVDTSGTYYWLVTYDTGDQAHTDGQSNCVENTGFTFTNDAGPGTPYPS